MSKSKKSSPLVLFYILVAYVFLQFCWWAYLIFDLNLEIHELKLTVYEGNEKALEGSLQSKIWMIFGEGTVFLSLLFLGFYQVKKAFQREVALAEQQRNFLLSITHELNSPLASVKLYLQTLLSRDVSTEKRNQILNNALSENERLNKLVDNVLIATRLDNSTYTFYFERINWSDFIETLIKENPKAQSRNISLRIQPNVQAPMDKTALASITLNLLENAIKYSNEGTIAIQLQKKDNGSISLTVSDEGQGILSHEKEQIFKKFYRIGSEETRKSKGTGLGLYIVQFLVKNLNGSITVKDNTPQGTVFEVLFYPNLLENLVEQMDVD